MKINEKIEKTEPEKIRFRSYRNYNKNRFNEELKTNLENSEFNTLIENKELNKAMDTWTEIFTGTAQKHAPMIVKTKKYKREGVPWFSNELEYKIKRKTDKLKLYRLYGNRNDLITANKITNEITHLKRKLKKKHYQMKIKEFEGDPKKLWNILKHLTQTIPDRGTVEPEFMDQEKANQINKFFATIGAEIQKSLGIKEASSMGKVGNFQFKEEDEDSIMKLIDRIRTDVATGVDDINAKLLKDSKHTVAKSLTKLVNLSYNLSRFPNSMKFAIIKPLHKKNCTEDASNYRPISILPVVSKIFERSATNQLVSYLEENKILNPTQHAYRKGHSTQTCLMEIINYIHKERDIGKIVGLASLDLSKAFDSINHAHLLVKLGKLGLGTFAVEWCKSYLSERSQKTKFKKYTSDEHIVTSGVPQGSILGPILFICFTNDMAELFTDCKVLSYADDTQLIVSGRSKNEVKKKLEALIRIAQSWYTRNSLKNNASKTEIIVIGNKRTDDKTPIWIEVTEDHQLEKLVPRKFTKILGIFIDDQLNWDYQMQNVRKKANNSIRNLHRINQLISVKHRVLLYNSLVTPHYSYVDTVWSGCGADNEKKLQVTQNFAARSILGRSKYSSAKNALQTLNLIPLKDKRKVHEAVYIHKALHGKLPVETTNQYRSLEAKQNHRSAKQCTLNIPKHKTEQYKKSPMYRTVKTWNSTPTELRTETNTSTFKKKYQDYLIQMYKH
jgi:hypothetical protein